VPRDLELVGRVISDEQEWPRSRVVVRQGRIAAVEPWDGPAPSRALDAESGWIIPGLIDIQINGAFGQDFADPAADLETAGRGLLRHGVTAFLPTVVTLPWEQYPAVLANLTQRPAGGARPLGVHLEGPWLAPRYHGAHPVEHLRAPRWAEVETLLGLGPVRMLTLAPELPGALEVIQRLSQQRVVVSLGHSGASWDEGRVALLNGARAGTHLFNAMPPLHHREPGLAGALLDDHQAVVGIIPDGIHVHPAVLRLVARLRGARRVVLVTDAIAAMGMPPGSYTLGERQVLSTRREARLVDGTLAGSVLTLDQALRAMVQLGGCPLPLAVAMVTSTPARLLGLEAERGRLAPGLVGDLVVLGPDLRVRWTVQEGSIVYSMEGAAR